MARRFLLLAWGVLCLGCIGKPPTPSYTNATHASSQKVVASPAGKEKARGEKEGDSLRFANSETAGEGAPAPEVDAVGPAAPADLPHLERFLLMAQGGPVLVEATLTIDGRPLREAMAQLVDALLADADTNGDGRATWSEVIESPAFKGGRYGNVEANTETEAARLVRLYDVNKNGVVDRDEVPRFLTRNAGGSRPFSLTSSNEYRGYNQFDSPTLRTLDEDRDGQLNRDEVAQAATRLRIRDADSDDILLVADFVSVLFETSPGQMSNRRRAAPDAAYLLDDQTQWEGLLYSLSELYAFGGELDATSFPQRRELFEQLDADRDGRVGRDEIRRLATIEPQIQLEVRFGQPAKAQEQEANVETTETTSSQDHSIGRPTLRLVNVAHELQVDAAAISQSDTRIALVVPGAELVFFANDGAAVDYLAQARSQISTYDANNDGYLSSDELPDGLPGTFGSFESLDGDSDGKLYPDELAEYLQQRAGAALCQIRARAADETDALFAALDADNDGRLETRELDRAPDLLLALDGDQDGVVASSELPGAIAVGFVRGDPQQVNSLFMAPAPALRYEDAPAWFRQMDFNSDGEISAREFLGDPDQFAALDANSDGFLSAQEVRDTSER